MRRKQAILLLLSALYLCCGTDEPEIETPPSSRLIGSNPPDRGVILVSGHLPTLNIELRFNHPPQLVTVNGTRARLVDSTARWFGWPADVEEMRKTRQTCLTVAWRNEDGSEGVGAHIILYIRFSEGGTPPTIASGNVEDGGQEVDPQPLNDEGITYRFSEAIRPGQIQIRPEDGDPLDWVAQWDNISVTIKPNPGAELEYSTVYVIDITGVTDLAGNALHGGVITFITKDKP